MYTSDNSDAKRQTAKTGIKYLIASIFCALVGGIYEVFSHGVYSNFMIYAFAFLLIGGALPFMILAYSHIERMPELLPRYLYHFGIVTMTVGSVVKGALDIYGTSNALTPYYFCVGAILVIIGINMYLIKAKTHR